MLVALAAIACARPAPPNAAVADAPTPVESSPTEGTDPDWSCERRTCVEVARSCGPAWDECGGFLDCGTCEGGLSCDMGVCRPATQIRHDRVENPFEGTAYYVRPAFRDAVLGTIQHAPRRYADALRTVAKTPSAVWLERIEGIEGGPDMVGVREHLDEDGDDEDEEGVVVLGTHAVVEPLAVVVEVQDALVACAAGLAPLGHVARAEVTEERLGVRRVLRGRKGRMRR